MSSDADRHRRGSRTFMEKTGQSRLRGSIKRKHTDRIHRWLNVGCGSCFLHDSSGKAREIKGGSGPGDMENKFPAALQRAMFLYTIDCRVPFNEDIVDEDSMCSICQQLMIDPATTGNADCKHMFCKLCLQQWSWMQRKATCPQCRAELKVITVQPDKVQLMKQGIPTTVYQQLMEENKSRFMRQYLVKTFKQKRQAELDEMALAEQVLDPQMANQAQGYDI